MNKMIKRSSYNRIAVFFLCGLLFLVSGCTNVMNGPPSQKSDDEVSFTNSILEFNEEINFTQLIQQSFPEYSPECDTYINVLQDTYDQNQCFFTISIRLPGENDSTGLLVRYNTVTKEVLSERFTKYRRFSYNAENWDKNLLITSIVHGNINMCAVDKDTLQYQNVSGGSYGGIWLVDTSTDTMYREGYVDHVLYLYAFDKNLETIWKFEIPSEEIQDHVYYPLKSFLYQNQFHVFYSAYEKEELLRIKHIVLDANGKLVFNETICLDYLSSLESNEIPSPETANRVFQKEEFVWMTSQKENEAWIEKYTIKPSGSLKLIWKKTLTNANIHGRDLHFTEYQQQSFFALCFDETSLNNSNFSEVYSKNNKSTNNGKIVCLHGITGDTLWTKSLPFSLQNTRCDMKLQENGNMEVLVPNIQNKEDTYQTYLLQFNFQDGAENAKQNLLSQDRLITHWHRGFYYLYDSEDQYMYVVNQVNNRYEIAKVKIKDFSNLQFYSLGDELYVLVKEIESVDELNHDKIYLYKVKVQNSPKKVNTL